MAAESVECIDAHAIACHFRAPVHLLVAYEKGERAGGESFVEGLRPSRLRSLAGKLIFVPAGHGCREQHQPRPPA